MARRLNPTALALSVSALAVLLAGAIAPASAQALPDPTRPPGNMEYGAAVGASSGLQTIIRRAGAKPRALINGEIVALGDKVGDSHLVAINADNVVLMDADGHRETLTLTPGISKLPVKTVPAASRRHSQPSVPR